MKNLQLGLQVFSFAGCRAEDRADFCGQLPMRGCCRFLRCPAGGAYEIALSASMLGRAGRRGAGFFFAKRGDAATTCPAPVLPVPPRGPDSRGGADAESRSRRLRFPEEGELHAPVAPLLPEFRICGEVHLLRMFENQHAFGTQQVVFEHQPYDLLAAPPDRRGRPRKSRRTVSDSF